MSDSDNKQKRSSLRQYRDPTHLLNNNSNYILTSTTCCSGEREYTPLLGVHSPSFKKQCIKISG